MDQSQIAATPLEPVTTAVLASKLRHVLPGQTEPASDEAAQENATRARSEIASIFELKDSRAFQWFEKEFIDKPYQDAFEKLRDPNHSNEGFRSVQLKYATLRAVKVGMIEREIAHRETLNPADEEIRRLQERLSGL